MEIFLHNTSRSEGIIRKSRNNLCRCSKHLQCRRERHRGVGHPLQHYCDVPKAKSNDIDCMSQELFQQLKGEVHCPSRTRVSLAGNSFTSQMSAHGSTMTTVASSCKIRTAMSVTTWFDNFFNIFRTQLRDCRTNRCAQQISSRGFNCKPGCWSSNAPEIDRFEDFGTKVQLTSNLFYTTSSI